MGSEEYHPTAFRAGLSAVERLVRVLLLKRDVTDKIDQQHPSLVLRDRERGLLFNPNSATLPAVRDTKKCGRYYCGVPQVSARSDDDVALAQQLEAGSVYSNTPGGFCIAGSARAEYIWFPDRS